MNIIILGDKFQKRMKSKGCVGLLENNKKTLLYNQYYTLKEKFPHANIIYVYGFDAKKFENYILKYADQYENLQIVYNKNYDLYNNSYSLYMAKNFLNQDCMIIFGDTHLNKKIFDRFDASNGSQIFLSLQNNHNLGCTISLNNNISNIDYDLSNYIYNIYYIQKEHIKSLCDLVAKADNYNCFIFELINKLIEIPYTKIKPLFIDQKKRSIA